MLLFSLQQQRQCRKDVVEPCSCNMSYCCTRCKSGVRSYSSDSYFHHHRWHKGSNLFSDQKQPDYNSSLSGSQGVAGPCDRNPIPGHCLCETSFTNLRFCSFSSPGGKPERSEIMGAREREVEWLLGRRGRKELVRKSGTAAPGESALLKGRKLSNLTKFYSHF